MEHFHGDSLKSSKYDVFIIILQMVGFHKDCLSCLETPIWRHSLPHRHS